MFLEINGVQYTQIYIIYNFNGIYMQTPILNVVIDFNLPVNELMLYLKDYSDTYVKENHLGIYVHYVVV